MFVKWFFLSSSCELYFAFSFDIKSSSCNSYKYWDISNLHYYSNDDRLGLQGLELQNYCLDLTLLEKSVREFMR